MFPFDDEIIYYTVIRHHWKKANRSHEISPHKRRVKSDCSGPLANYSLQSGQIIITRPVWDSNIRPSGTRYPRKEINACNESTLRMGYVKGGVSYKISLWDLRKLKIFCSPYFYAVYWQKWCVFLFISTDVGLLSLMVKIVISRHWFRWWLGDEKAAGYILN